MLLLAQPDLVARIKHNVSLAEYNRDTFYLYGPTHPEGAFISFLWNERELTLVPSRRLHRLPFRPRACRRALDSPH